MKEERKVDLGKQHFYHQGLSLRINLTHTLFMEAKRHKRMLQHTCLVYHIHTESSQVNAVTRMEHFPWSNYDGMSLFQPTSALSASEACFQKCSPVSSAHRIIAKKKIILENNPESASKAKIPKCRGMFEETQAKTQETIVHRCLLVIGRLPGGLVVRIWRCHCHVLGSILFWVAVAMLVE